MAWIEKHGNGHRVRWEGASGLESGPTIETRDEAMQWALSNGHMQVKRLKLSELTDKWCELRPLEGNPISPAAPYWVRQQMLAIIRDRGWVYPDEVTIEAVDKWRLEHGGRIRSALQTLLMILRWSAAHRIVFGLRPEILNMRLPPRNNERQLDSLLTDDQIHTLQDRATAISPHAGALVHYLITYGARPVTAANILISDIDWEESTLKLRHVKRRRPFVHALLDETVRIFAAIAYGRAKTEHLFLDPRNMEHWKITKQGSAQALNSWYFRAISRGNRKDESERIVPSGIYDLKRYAITTMLARGIDAATVQTFTGHLTLAQVLKYARTNFRSPHSHRK